MFCRLIFLPLFILTVAPFAQAPAWGDAVALPPATRVLAVQEAAADQMDLPMLKMIRDLSTPGIVSGVTWSSDGTKLAAYSHDAGGAGIPGIVYVPSEYSSLITVWNADGTVFRELRRPRPFINPVDDRFAFVAANKQIAAPPPIDSNDLAFSVFDVASGKSYMISPATT